MVSLQILPSFKIDIFSYIFIELNLVRIEKWVRKTSYAWDKFYFLSYRLDLVLLFKGSINIVEIVVSLMKLNNLRLFFRFKL